MPGKSLLKNNAEPAMGPAHALISR